MSEYPRVVVSGGPVERCRRYGELTRGRVELSLRGYAEAFEGIAGMSWEEARREAGEFVPAIERYGAHHLQELGGIAEGAGVELLDVLALNVRYELIMSARVLGGEAGGGAGECTSIACTAEATVEGGALIGQNWDYLPHARETTVVLQIEQDDGVRIVTVVEAGLLGKIGMNDAGFALVTNGLASTLDPGARGVPYHVLLRRLLGSRSVAEAVETITQTPRASTANFMLAEPRGGVVNVEAWPGSGGYVDVQQPREGVLVHANDCLSEPDDGSGRPFNLSEASAPRYAHAQQLVSAVAPAAAVADIQRVLADHLHHPFGICTHDDHESEPAGEPFLVFPTLASLIMQPDTRLMLLADGNPCTAPYRELDTTALTPKDGR